MPKQIESHLDIPLTLVHDGLAQTSTRTVTYVGDMHGPTRIRVQTTLPPYVLPEYWNRYELPQDDVYKLGNWVDARLWWLSCLVHGFDVPAACIRPSFARADEVLIGSKLDAIRTLMTRYPNMFKTAKKPVLDTTSAESMRHIPPLPSRDVNEGCLPQIRKLLHPRPKAFEIDKVRGLYEWRGKKYLPVGIEGDNIYLQRATPYENYEKSRKRQKYGCATMPFVVQTPDGTSHALCEEGVLLSGKV